MDSSIIISEILNMMRHSSDTKSVLAYVCETLTKAMDASRCVLWTVEGENLQVSEEYSLGSYCFKDNVLSSQESVCIVLEFLSRFPDDSGGGVIYIPDVTREQSLHNMSDTLASLIELGDVRSRLMAQLRSQGIFSGKRKTAS